MRSIVSLYVRSCFFFNDTATTEIYTLSLHDALPIFRRVARRLEQPRQRRQEARRHPPYGGSQPCVLALPLVTRSEEHTSELQSRQYLVCRLLLEKKKQIYQMSSHSSYLIC